ncbi:MAG: glutaredoxin family protein [Deltaproteobacteria bacterium]|nr:glutaredoxin family protein [Deltaproteobacteria bacterium]
MTPPRFRLAALAALVALALPSACSKGGDAADRPPAAPVVRESSTGFSFFWFDSAGAVHRVARISDVPPEARDRVLVQPLEAEAGSGAWAFVADLRRPGENGAFPVQVLTREAYSNEVRARLAASRPAEAAETPEDGGPSSSALPTASGKVAIYLTQGCPHCRRAKEWMTRAGIPFVEHDIEADAAAARWVMQNAGSTAVPVFQVGKRVLQGFNPDALRQAVESELGIRLL